MATTPEARLTARIVAYLKTVPGCVVEKRHGSPYGKGGQPDVSGCVPVKAFRKAGAGGYTQPVGQRFEIEVKMPGNKPTILQEQRLAEWRESGAVCIVAYSVEDVKQMMGGILE